MYIIDCRPMNGALDSTIDAGSLTAKPSSRVVYLLMWRQGGEELANMKVEVAFDLEPRVGDDTLKADCARSSTV
jgi:hypothetical protein